MSKDDRLGKIVRLLEPRFGGCRTISAEKPLDQLVLGILARHSSQKRAEQALKKLKTGFVDWNEIRVSTVYEIAQAVAATGSDDAVAKAALIRQILALIYSRYNRLNLDFLDANEADGSARKRDRFFATLGEKSPALVSMMKLAVAKGDPSLEIVGNGVQRVLARLGIVKKQPSLGDVKEALSAGLAESEWPIALWGLHCLAEELCLARGPKCPECPASKSCPAAGLDDEGGAEAKGSAKAASARAKRSGGARRGKAQPRSGK